MLTIKKKVDIRVVFKRTISLSFLSVFFIGLAYFVFSPVMIVAISSTGVATPTLTVSKEVNVSSPGVISMGPSIPGITGNTSSSLASGTATFTVQANSVAGFTMTLHASQANALASGAYNFTDYAPATPGTPDFSWQEPSDGSTAFAFSIGADTAAYANQKFRYATTTCNTGNLNSANNCFYGFDSTTPITVISTTQQTTGTGSNETVKFWAEFYNPSLSTSFPSGTYTATITATVSSN
jgi:hypothetical protein